MIKFPGDFGTYYVRRMKRLTDKLKNKRERTDNQKKLIAGKVLALVMALAVFLSTAGIPQQTYAASLAKKSKYKYKVTVHNINSNTVLRKGQKIKISYTATKTKKGKVSGTKVKFKSSKKKVASVSKKGVIKAKKKGTAYITVYCKSKPSKKKKIKIRVGTPVSSVSISGYRYLRVGRGSDLDASVNKGATNKSVSWWSDNTAVATVNSNGYVKAKSPGTCTIYATAKDGSGVYGTRTVVVHQYLAGEANWIAHRGLHTSATENTAAAFEAAGQTAGFWGIECDIWETRHVGTNESLPEDPSPEEPIDPEDPVSETGAETGGADYQTVPAEGDPAASTEGGENTEEDPAVTAVVSEISELGLTGNETMLQAIDIRTGIESAKTSYDDLNAEQKYQVRLALKDGDTEGLQYLLSAVSKLAEYDSIALAINHDSTFSSVWGNGNYVRNLSRDEISAQLPGVCFFETYLDICKRYNKVPVIEYKDPYMSPEAINKSLDMVAKRGLLDKAVYISFYHGILTQVKAQAEAKNAEAGISAAPVTYFLINDGGSSGSAQIDSAKSAGFTGVSLSKNIIDSSLYSRAKNHGLGVGTWTYKNQASDDDKLYKHLISYGWQLDFATVDYKIFR